MQLNIASVFKAQFISLVYLDSKAKTNLLVSASVVESYTFIVKLFFDLKFTLAAVEI